MNNYNSISFTRESSSLNSRYIRCGEQNQSQWINSTAKQAAKLISVQLIQTKIKS